MRKKFAEVSFPSFLRNVNIRTYMFHMPGPLSYLSSSPKIFFPPTAQVNSYTQKTFELLVREFRSNKCDVLHASANQITFATGKLTYAEALEHFGHLRDARPLVFSKTDRDRTEKLLSWYKLPTGCTGIRALRDKWSVMGDCPTHYHYHYQLS